MLDRDPGQRAPVDRRYIVGFGLATLLALTVEACSPNPIPPTPTRRPVIPFPIQILEARTHPPIITPDQIISEVEKGSWRIDLFEVSSIAPRVNTITKNLQSPNRAGFLLKAITSPYTQLEGGFPTWILDEAKRPQRKTSMIVTILSRKVSFGTEGINLQNSERFFVGYRDSGLNRVFSCGDSVNSGVPLSTCLDNDIETYIRTEWNQIVKYTVDPTGLLPGR